MIFHFLVDNHDLPVYDGIHDMRYDINKLERARRLKGWTKTRLAQAVGVQAPTISHIWNGHTKNAETLKQIADVLGLTVEEILIEEVTTGNPAA